MALKISRLDDKFVVSALAPKLVAFVVGALAPKLVALVVGASAPKLVSACSRRFSA
jgi:hypothetical protein